MTLDIDVLIIAPLLVWSGLQQQRTKENTAGNAEQHIYASCVLCFLRKIQLKNDSREIGTEYVFTTTLLLHVSTC